MQRTDCRRRNTQRCSAPILPYQEANPASTSPRTLALPAGGPFPATDLGFSSTVPRASLLFRSKPRPPSTKGSSPGSPMAPSTICSEFLSPDPWRKSSARTSSSPGSTIRTCRRRAGRRNIPRGSFAYRRRTRHCPIRGGERCMTETWLEAFKSRSLLGDDTTPMRYWIRLSILVCIIDFLGLIAFDCWWISDLMCFFFCPPCFCGNSVFNFSDAIPREDKWRIWSNSQMFIWF